MLISSSRRRVSHIPPYPSFISQRKALTLELDTFDKEKTKKLAKEHAEAALKKSGQF
jgi:hypothetical protein